MAVDCEAIVIRALKTVGLETSDEVGEPWPMVRVFVVDGIRPTESKKMNREQLQVEAWGLPNGSKADTRALMEQALQVCYDLNGTVQPEGVVSHVDHDGGPSWLPDPTDRHPRYVATVTIYAHEE